MADLEFDLGQAWSKGLRIVFEDAADSARFNAKVAFHVEQVHGAEIHEVSPQDLSRVSPLARADGLMARGAWFRDCKRPLLIKTADCAPLVYVDRLQETVCVLHAGWRGLAAGFHLEPFRRGYCEPKNTWVWIGPCLNGQNFEVGEDLRESFARHRDRTEIFEPRGSGKYDFHVWRMMDEDIRVEGVDLVYNVEVDTFADSRFASHRRSLHEGSERGSNYTWVKFFP